MRPIILLLPTPAHYQEPGPAEVIQPKEIVDLTKQLKPDGTLEWNVPAGATYRKAFNLAQVSGGKTYLGLGVVHDMARVKLNGKDLGVVWCAPWRVEVTGTIKAGANQLEIEVANRWQNRLVGDKQPSDAGVRTVNCPPGFLGGTPHKAGRYTFSTCDPTNPQSPLFPSGLLGPVRIMK